MEFKTDKFKIMTINKELGLKQEKVQAVTAKEDLVKDIKSESKKWKSIDKDFSLVYHLNKSTKDELLSIAKNLNINKVSRLKKDDLINKIVELYKDRINEIIENIDSEKLNYLIDLATKKEGYEDNINEIDIHSVYYFRERAILFTGKINEKYVVVMPKEVQELIISKNTKVNSDTKTIIKPRKIGRNELCPCGSGKKYKRCCGSRI